MNVDRLEELKGHNSFEKSEIHGPYNFCVIAIWSPFFNLDLRFSSRILIEINHYRNLAIKSSSMNESPLDDKYSKSPLDGNSPFTQATPRNGHTTLAYDRS
jgi:hypothetical protein